MSTFESSATAYERLSVLTDQYGENQARLQDLRVLTRALRTLTATYCTEETVASKMGQAIVKMTDAASVERNRLYQDSNRLTQEMDTLNARIQNGVYNEGKE